MLKNYTNVVYFTNNDTIYFDECLFIYTNKALQNF